MRLAYGLLCSKNDWEVRILHALLGRPKRYSELKPLLGGRRDNNLTVALQRLQGNGLVDRRTDARLRPVVHTYELTPLSIQVVLALESLRPLHKHLGNLERAREGARA